MVVCDLQLLFSALFGNKYMVNLYMCIIYVWFGPRAALMCCLHPTTETETPSPNRHPTHSAQNIHFQLDILFLLDPASVDDILYIQVLGRRAMRTDISCFC